MSIALRLDEGAPLPRAPFVLCWGDPDNPLPVRAVRGPARSLALSADAPPWLTTGPLGQVFDFCGHVRQLCADIALRCDALRHVDLSRLLFAVTQARSGQVHGLQARVTPLRFPGGSLTRHRRGVAYQVQRYFVDRREMLYLVTFCLPRFLDLDFDEKFITLFHELYHISPAFDGDLRRHAGRCAVHSRSQRLYDQHMAALARAYLADGADPSLHAFLRLDFGQLRRRHGGVVGVVVPRPKLIPVVRGP
ncbi:MAG TPA: hypothetical protein VG013_35130 [Gemmataceae bacterium]|nr:hypothetical protein [Gemmataceae bacterium]